MTRPTEAQCQDTIIRAAEVGGWRVHAERAAQRQSGRWATPIQGHRGFPDLVLARAGVLVVAELKRKPNRVEPDQAVWLDELAATGAHVAVWWVPEQMDAVCQALASGRVPEAGRVAA